MDEDRQLTESGLATFALIHGAASDSWYWHLVAPRLRDHGHDVLAIDLPCDDDSAGFGEYAQTVIDAVDGRTGLVLVAQSLGGFTAPLVCERRPVELLVLVNAMVPSPGEPAGEWWENTAQPAAMVEHARRGGWDASADELMADPEFLFLHDVPPDVAKASLAHVRDQSGTPFGEPWPLDAWPDVPTRFLLSRDDRLFPAEFMRRVVRERLGITPDEIDGGHLVALSRPKELASKLIGYLEDDSLMRHSSSR